MTLRDYFAAKAIAGMCANPRPPIDLDSRQQAAVWAYAIADELLAERSK
jgi:hypothetical protein